MVRRRVITASVAAHRCACNPGTASVDRCRHADDLRVPPGGRKSQVWEAYIGDRYWYNKFGTDHSSGLYNIFGCSVPSGIGFGCTPGTSIESTAYIGTTYHFK